MNNSKKYQEGRIDLQQRKNKAIKECKEKYEKLVTQTTKISEESKSNHEQIDRECDKISQTMAKLKHRSKEYIKSCVEAVIEQKKNPEITCVSELAAYLKSQKQLLKSIAESKQTQKTNKIDLHEMLGKIQLERVLRRLKKEQLEQQIKFLESNVLVKGNFIYNPSSLLVSPAEEKESQAKLQNLVMELERVIKLSIPCAVLANNTNKLALLTSQQSRISECQRILEEEHSKLMKFTKFVQETKRLPDKFSYGQPYMRQNQPESDQLDSFSEAEINVDQINEILQMKDPKTSVISLNHPFAAIEQNISQLRSKIKKIEQYS